jgi:hypothetical protein
MKKHLRLITLYLNIIYSILLISVISIINHKSDILLDFRITNSNKYTFIVASILYWIIVLFGIILNVKRIGSLLLVIIISVINFFLIEEAANAFMPW